MDNPIVDEFLTVYTNLKRWLLRETGNADDAADLARESISVLLTMFLNSIHSANREYRWFITIAVLPSKNF